MLGCRHTLEFPVAKLTDYEEKLDELLASDNAFGWITAAHILTQKTKTQDEGRYNAKLRLLRILYERHWDKQRVINLFNVIDWLMQMPEWAAEQLVRAKEEDLEAWAKAIFTATTLEAVFRNADPS